MTPREVQEYGDTREELGRQRERLEIVNQLRELVNLSIIIRDGEVKGSPERMIAVGVVDTLIFATDKIMARRNP